LVEYFYFILKNTSGGQYQKNNNKILRESS
jgi:hypothetical protein